MNVVMFFIWLDYFTNPVNTVIGSHSVYYSAIPLGIGVKKGGCFQVNLHNVYRLSTFCL